MRQSEKEQISKVVILVSGAVILFFLGINLIEWITDDGVTRVVLLEGDRCLSDRSMVSVVSSVRGRPPEERKTYIRELGLRTDADDTLNADIHGVKLKLLGIASISPLDDNEDWDLAMQLARYVDDDSGEVCAEVQCEGDGAERRCFVDKPD